MSPVSASGSSRTCWRGNPGCLGWLGFPPFTVVGWRKPQGAQGWYPHDSRLFLIMEKDMNRIAMILVLLAASQAQGDEMNYNWSTKQYSLTDETINPRTGNKSSSTYIFGQHWDDDSEPERRYPMTMEILRNQERLLNQRRRRY
jgi:hypothetical protein